MEAAFVKTFRPLIALITLVLALVATPVAAYESKPVAEQGQALTQPKININTADAETLASQLKGIGQSRAEAIVAYREAHGPFTSVDDLTAVRGIGQRTLEQNEGLLSVE